MTITLTKPHSLFYEQFLGKVDTRLLHIRDANETFILDKMDNYFINYFARQVLDKPWNNHLYLYMITGIEKNLDPQSISYIIKVLNVRIKDLFEHYHLIEIKQLNTEMHMYEYFKGTIFKNHSDDQRSKFLSQYISCSYNVKKWVKTKLPEEQQDYFEQFIFPMPSYDSRDFKFTKTANVQRKNTRKSETDAIVDFLPQIRADGHFRWNQIDRLRKMYLKACEEVKNDNLELPFNFEYDEPERVGERFCFRLWDRPTFVLHHQAQFSQSVIRMANNRISAYSDENNHYFVEFIGAERLKNDDEAEGLWFLELIETDVIGSKIYHNASEGEIQRKLELLNSWGYGNEGELPRPFHGHKGILGQNAYVTRNKDKAEGLLFDVEPFYAAATFGLLGVDICTSTGARISELMQINNTKESIKATKVEGDVKYSFYAIPKGRDEAEQFFITTETMKIITKVRKMLLEHYETEKIPSVDYGLQERKHLFKEPKPYFFQYHKKALNSNSISSCLRFLLHGLNFETQEGKPVTIKTHLLRHAFATEAVQRHGVSTDIVAKLLHQRDIKVTGYYSEPTQSQVAQEVSELHDIIMDYIDIDEALLRSPEELHQEFKEYKENVGVLNNVIGGVCVTNMVCPTKMACLGCQAKIPQPEKKNELEEVIVLSRDMEKRFSAMNLPIEVKKAKAMRRQARTELQEIELIEQYRKEEDYDPDIQFKK
ncbi:tyrosine-type recombinase/integrase [Lysinibacillus xylanilyticus]|uniref:tyrosine-type recombinase/integrase n=1 Tax=Lysinibacillus xylanilyticus TaxID=582475 RepID=UPI002B244EA9|nr:tyrosine-type recombinase/integrase [Lysinibacillus xylanilyticus]MEB2301653.1 tyrosine-type recombinase/integrase [Lysinibacillus xylanilyticus]